MGDPLVMTHLGGQPLAREDAWRKLLCGAGLWGLLGYGYWAVERREDGALHRPGRLRRLQARHDAVDRGPARNGLAVRRPTRSGRAMPAKRSPRGAGLGRSGAASAARSSRSSIAANAPRSGSRRKAASRTRETGCLSRIETILIFRRPLAATRDRPPLLGGKAALARGRESSEPTVGDRAPAGRSAARPLRWSWSRSSWRVGTRVRRCRPAGRSRRSPGQGGGRSKRVFTLSCSSKRQTRPVTG